MRAEPWGGAGTASLQPGLASDPTAAALDRRGWGRSGARSIFGVVRPRRWARGPGRGSPGRAWSFRPTRTRAERASQRQLGGSPSARVSPRGAFLHAHEPSFRRSLSLFPTRLPSLPPESREPRGSPGALSLSCWLPERFSIRSQPAPRRAVLSFLGSWKLPQGWLTLGHFRLRRQKCLRNRSSTEVLGLRRANSSVGQRNIYTHPFESRNELLT